MAGLYEIRNTANGKRYVGSTVNLRKRRIEHFSKLRTKQHHNQHLQRAWNTYGESAFAFRPLAVLERDELAPTETRLIQRIIGKETCYNTGMASEAPWLGKPLSDEHRWKIGLSRRGKSSAFRHTQESKDKISAKHRGKRLSAETRAAISATRKTLPRKTMCKHGHPFDEANTNEKMLANGVRHRRCRACNRDQQRRYKAAARAENG